MADNEETLICSLNNAQSVWNVLSERVEALSEAWRSSAEAPELSEFVPERPATLRSLALIELIKVDLEHRWKEHRAPKRIEQYIDDFPELGAGGSLPIGLVYEEYRVRRKFGEEVDKQEYFDRFRHRIDEVQRLFDQDDPRLTTAVFGAEQPAEFDVGDGVDDFDLLTRLGKGAFATVFLARQRSLQRLVALKISADRGMEPQTLAQLDHPNIVRVYDQRVIPERSLRLLYMQYVTGGTLEGVIERIQGLATEERTGQALLAAVDQALDQRGESPPTESTSRTRLARTSWSDTVCLIGVQLAAALQYAHQLGVLHRDIKPANILLTAEGSPKLVDFNVSSCSKVDGAGPAAFFGGSLAYMSPEQLEAAMPSHERTPDSLTSTSDVYSLGVLLWEVLTAQRPFEDEQLEEGWEATLNGLLERRRAGLSPAALGKLPANCPTGLKDLLLKCLRPDPAERFQSAGEVTSAFRLCLRPAAQNLLSGAGQGWRPLIRKYSLLAIVIAALLPNALAGVFNYYYNHSQIVAQLVDESAKVVFERLVLAVNLVAFPLGIAIMIALYLPAARTLKAIRAEQQPSNEALVDARRRCLKSGHYAAVVGIVEWFIAGFVYPIVLQMTGAPMKFGDWGHFVGSLAVCGLIAAAYPFFGVTALGVHCVYPTLFRPESATASDLDHLAWLNRATWVYLAMAALVPMLAIVMLVGLSETPNQPVLVIVCTVAIGGLLCSFWLARLLQTNCATMADLITSGDDSLSMDSTQFTDSTIRYR